MGNLKNIFLLALIIFVFSMSGIASADNADTITVKTLYAGQDIEVGTLTVSNDCDHLNVTYRTGGNWSILESHLAVAGSFESIPITKSGNPIPGHFAHKNESLPNGTQILEYTLPLSSEEGTLYIAAHAAVHNGSCRNTSNESAWAEGTSFPGKNWATYFTYEILTCCDEDGTGSSDGEDDSCSPGDDDSSAGDGDSGSSEGDNSSGEGDGSDCGDDSDSSGDSDGSDCGDDSDSSGDSDGSDCGDDSDSSGDSDGSDGDDSSDSSGDSDGSDGDDSSDSSGDSDGSDGDDSSDSSGGSEGSNGDDSSDSSGDSEGSNGDDSSDSSGANSGRPSVSVTSGAGSSLPEDEEVYRTTDVGEDEEPINLLSVPAEDSDVRSPLSEVIPDISSILWFIIWTLLSAICVMSGYGLTQP
ncbi:hypothetical protein [Methanolobus halotolerans]|uniref:Uncharacterized protein n=1 Tax=Methanolobus halotolerans TaxID=2052935 RepID=A0A4E0QBS5_9EURY|nr:hypothetical protein [Methanolobus halotolerans]TGC10634.1 hypothetical protein CUN85_03850 [Methanolobus halotolerans]